MAGGTGGLGTIFISLLTPPPSCIFFSPGHLSLFEGVRHHMKLCRTGEAKHRHSFRMTISETEIQACVLGYRLTFPSISGRLLSRVSAAFEGAVPESQRLLALPSKCSRGRSGSDRCSSG